jgi:DNA invertase Pin-like site-specific DNA recombinase
MFADAKEKVTASHLARNAYLYVRQSTMRQVFENTESTKRQYALKEKALALGWPTGSVIVIDSDLGQSGAQAVDREGFKRLVADVSLGKAGVVLGLEVSRLARNSSDWHRLLEICALSDTLILDEDGLYNPAQFNDRLLLGLKGTMSEAELHVLRARLVGGQRSKARRGELKLELPVGFVYDANDHVQLDPDRQVQETIKVFFDTFKHTGSAFSACRELQRQSILVPRKVRNGQNRGEIAWDAITHTYALSMLHNPRYAGTYAYGRNHFRKNASGKMVQQKRAQRDWIAFIPGAHVGYITQEQFDENQRRLKECSQSYGHDRRKSTPREGPALLQGLAICGICGERMTVRYHARKGRLIPDYVCQKQSIRDCRSGPCQSIPATTLEKFVSDLLLETISPMTLEVALSVQDELQARYKDASELKKKHLQRLKYDSDLSRRRYLAVDPDNRLVAASLEADWNEKIRMLADAQQEFEKRAQEQEMRLRKEQREEILSLASNFPKLWNDPSTPDRERKRIVRLVIEDATLRRTSEDIFVDVRFRGGATHSAKLPVPLAAWQSKKTPAKIVELIDQLLDHHTDLEVAEIINKRGILTGPHDRFTQTSIANIRYNYHLRPRYDRLRASGCLEREEMLEMIGITYTQLNWLREHNLVRSHRVANARKQFLYEQPNSRQRQSILRVLRDNLVF